MRYIKLMPLLLLGACMGADTVPTEIVTTPEPETAPVIAATKSPVIIEEAPPPPVPEPSRLSGLNPKEVQALVGDPSLVRRDQNVQIMLFENRNCVFEIIFYEPDLNAYFRADHINARDRNGADMDLQSCLISILPGGRWLDASAP